MIIKYTPQLKIINTEQLPHGTGTRYLLALQDKDTYIAHSWKRIKPDNIPNGYALIDFKK